MRCAACTTARTAPTLAAAALLTLAAFFATVDVPGIFTRSLSLRRRGWYQHPALAGRRTAPQSGLSTLLQSWFRGCTFDAYGEPTAACCLSADNLGGRPYPENGCGGPIDVVYTWVNGSDPQWLAEMLAWRAKEGPPDEPSPSPSPPAGSGAGVRGSSTTGGAAAAACRPRTSGGAATNSSIKVDSSSSVNGTLLSSNSSADALPLCPETDSGSGTNTTSATASGSSSGTSGIASVNRYRDNDELRYSFRSLEKYAPWIRRIYLVTNGQVPVWLDVTHPRLRIVTHAEIFPPEAAGDLPVFSSPAIEVHLHRIPGLSPSFIYFNDDVMLGSDVSPDDFGSRSGGQKVYLSWEVPKCAPGCVDNWLGDGWCDAACNTTRCLFDGGDCLNATAVARGSSYSRGSAGRFNGAAGVGGTAAGGPGGNRPLGYSATAEAVLGAFPSTGTTAVGSLTTTPPCNSGCPDTWIGDKMCDTKCDCVECGWDGGDCGWGKVTSTVSEGGGVGGAPSGHVLSGLSLEPLITPSSGAAETENASLPPVAASIVATLQAAWREALASTAGVACTPASSSASSSENATAADADATSVTAAALACAALAGNLTAAVSGGYTTAPIAADTLMRGLWQGGVGQLLTDAVAVPVEPPMLPAGLAQPALPPGLTHWSATGGVGKAQQDESGSSSGTAFRLWLGGMVPTAALAPNATVPTGNVAAAATALRGLDHGSQAAPDSDEQAVGPSFFYLNVSDWLGTSGSASATSASAALLHDVFLAREAVAAALSGCVNDALAPNATASTTLWACIGAAAAASPSASAAALPTPPRIAAADQSGGLFPGAYPSLFGAGATAPATAAAAAAAFVPLLTPPPASSPSSPFVLDEVAVAGALSAARWVSTAGLSTSLPPLAPAYALLRPAAGGDAPPGTREAVRPIRGRAGLPVSSAPEGNLLLPIDESGAFATAPSSSALLSLLGNATFGGTVAPEYSRSSSVFLSARDAFLGLLRPAMSARHHTVVDVTLGLRLDAVSTTEEEVAVAALRAAFRPSGTNASTETPEGMDADPVTALLNPGAVPLTALAFPPLQVVVAHEGGSAGAASCRLPIGATALWLKLVPEPSAGATWSLSNNKQLEVAVPITYTACPVLHLRVTPILHLAKAAAEEEVGHEAASGSGDRRRLLAVETTPLSSADAAATVPLLRLPVAVAGASKSEEEDASEGEAAPPRRLAQQQLVAAEEEEKEKEEDDVNTAFSFVPPAAAARQAAAAVLRQAGVALGEEEGEGVTPPHAARRLAAVEPSVHTSLAAAVAEAWRDVVDAAATAATTAAATSASTPASASSSSLRRPSARRLSADTYADSLIFTNQMITRRFGRRARKVPAHMPHLIRRDVMERLQATFPEQYAATSRHRFRSSEDVQYALAYFYFLIEGGARAGIDLNVYWRRELDTDGDGLLSQNEFRTLAMVAFKKPPSDVLVASMRHCFSGPDANLFSFDDLLRCEPVKEGLSKNARFGPTHTDASLDEVAFEMVGDDVNKTLGQLDGVRGRKPKFVCINDDMREAPAPVQAALAAFYQSIVPLPSSFELPEGEANPVLYIEPLRRHLAIRRGLAIATVVFPVVAAATIAALFLWSRCGAGTLAWLSEALFLLPSSSSAHGGEEEEEEEPAAAAPKKGAEVQSLQAAGAGGSRRGTSARRGAGGTASPSPTTSSSSTAGAKKAHRD